MALGGILHRVIQPLVHAARLRAGQGRVVHPPTVGHHRGRFADPEEVLSVRAEPCPDLRPGVVQRLQGRSQ